MAVWSEDNLGLISHSEATDITIAGGDSNYGGLVGYNEPGGLISRSYAAEVKVRGDAIADNSDVATGIGGLVGRNSSTMTHTYLLRGTVVGGSGSSIAYAGGLGGY